jgi:predicted metal-binding protein
MKDLTELKKIALECGFSHVGDLDADTITLRQEARDACATNKCRLYDKHWSCPPGCGTLEECSEKLRRYRSGIIVQTTGALEDSLDFDAIMEIKKADQAAFDKFVTIAREKYPGCLIMGDVRCKNCIECSYPDKPCRFPGEMISKMEAYGMIVSDVCAKNNINYYYGPGTLTFVGCILVE